MAEESTPDTTPHDEESAEQNQVADEAPPAAEATQEEAPEAAAEASPTAEENAENEGATTEAADPGPLPADAAVAEPPPEDGGEAPAAAAEEAKADGEQGGEEEGDGDGEKAEVPSAEGGDATTAAADDAAAAAEQEGGEGAAATTTEGEAAPVAAEGETAGSQQEGETAPAPAEGETPAADGDGEGAAAATGDGEGAPEPGEGGDGEAAAPKEDDEAAEGETAAAGQPSSEEFADGERPESPPRVSEKLSREPTPTAEEAQLRADRIDEVDEEAERPEPSSPDAIVATFDELELDDAEEEEADAEEEEDDDYEEEEVEEEEFNREHMIASYKQAMQEREQKLHQNSLLQTKLSDYFRRKKADQGGQADAGQETEKSITDQEQRYAKFVFNLDELRHSRDTKRQEFDDRIQEMELDCQNREDEVRRLFQGLLDVKRKVGLKSVSTTNGRPFPAVTQTRPDGSGGKAQDLLSTCVDDMLQDEAALEDQVVRVRLDNIGLGNRVRKCETALKDKEELSEGLHMIDFEQLKIENQTYNEKIEERQEELLKLKKKITNNVQVLTHLKEKLQFVQCKKQEQCEGLDELDQILSKRRDQLTRTKQARDSLRNGNQRLKQNSGLLGNEALLRNFEENVDLTTEKRDRLDKLKMEHSEMTLQCSKLKRKIDVARAQSAQ